MANELTLENLQTQIRYRKEAAKARDRRMDLWQSLYLLIDKWQLQKTPGEVRFVSNEPQTVVDLALTVISRNPLQARIPMSYVEGDEDRSAVGKLEHGIKGAFMDIDRQMTRRGLPPARVTAAWHLLIRGWAANLLIVRDDPHPLDYEPWDMRFTYPEFDRKGLASVIYEGLNTWGDILEAYPGVADELSPNDKAGFYGADLGQWVTQYEVWDRHQSAVAITRPRKPGRDAIRPNRPSALLWADKPAPHNIKDEVDEPFCPVIIIPSHGFPFQTTPAVTATSPIYGPADFPAQMELPLWKRPGGWTADQGRSFLAAVEDTVPQFNDLLATIWQILHNDAYGTWVATTRTGAAFDVEIGNNAVNFMRTGEGLGRVPGMAASPDIYRLLEAISTELQQGTADQTLLRGLMEFRGSGFLRAQMENAAVTALGPWIQAYEMWASENAQSMMNQLRQGSGRQFTVWAEGSRRRLFKMEFGPEDVEELVLVEMKSKPSLPDDLAVRVNIAAQLANPARPLASIQTIFDKVLEWEDAEREKELLFDDLADLDPMVVLLRLQNRMYARGMPEVANIFGEQAFAQAFVAKALAGQAIQQAMGGPVGRPETAAPPMANPEAAPPETAGIEPGRQGVEPTPAGAAETV